MRLFEGEGTFCAKPPQARSMPSDRANLMREVLFEKPLLIGVMGTIAAVLLGFIWLQTGRKQALYAFVAVLMATVAGILVAVSVVTDREAVENVLHDVARAVQHNDLNAVLEYVHPKATLIRDQASAELPRYEFQEVKIKQNLEITFDKPDLPTEATAKFNVTVIASQRGEQHVWRVPRYVLVTFRKDGDTWRFFSYEHFEATEGLLERKSKGY